MRTCHLISNIRITELVNGQPSVASRWQVNVYRPEKRHSFSYFGFYEHRLHSENDEFRIAKKKVTLLNDVVESVLDVNHV